jgi:hypothetical protein
LAVTVREHGHASNHTVARRTFALKASKRRTFHVTLTRAVYRRLIKGSAAATATRARS